MQKKKEEEIEYKFRKVLDDPLSLEIMNIIKRCVTQYEKSKKRDRSDRADRET